MADIDDVINVLTVEIALLQQEIFVRQDAINRLREQMTEEHDTERARRIARLWRIDPLRGSA